MELITSRLVLKEITWDHLEEVHKLHTIPEVDEFNTMGLAKSIAETRENIRPFIDIRKDVSQKAYNWAVFLKEDDTFIGMSGMFLSMDKYKMGEIYYKLLPKFWGQGFATEVARKMIDFGFDQLKLHRIEAGTAVGNIHSENILLKIGMSHEGLRRKILPIRGQWVDGNQFAIVEDDPRT
ncbi:MAG: GNAT family N-acetyltransferase [Salinivirgaceae bacterium]|nr:GNAT family N-acetyltransferase [Salinivirgaceae bacterium]